MSTASGLLERQLGDALVVIVAREVSDPRVLEVMRELPRHVFVPEHTLGEAYADHPLTIGYAATISQPTIVGIMSEALALGGTERILEIGAGSGYQAAVLSRMARHKAEPNQRNAWADTQPLVNAPPTGAVKAAARSAVE